MRVERALVVVLCILALEATGCGGRLAYNLPPSNRLMEPGPGVGGPGPGVIPPMGGGYPGGGGGYFGAGVGRFGDGMGGGTYMGGYGAGDCGPCVGQSGMPAPNQMQGMPGPNNGMQQNSSIQQAGFNCGESCDTCGGGPGGYMDGGCVEGGCSDGYCDCGPGAGGCPIGPGACSGCGLFGGGHCGLCGGGGLHGGGGGLHGGGGLLGRLRGHGCGCVRPGSMEAYAGGGGAMMATSQVAFLGAEGVQVQWDVSGCGMFDSEALVIPGRQDFYQGAIYRLKLTNISGRPGVELYPTLEIAPVTPRTDAYLAHAPIPVQFTEEDFDQVLSGNFVTKVIYLPDPEFQELALAGVETLVSTRLDPGVDPIAEADRRGSILAILRIGNKDLETGDNGVYESQGVIPAAHNESGTSAKANQAVYHQEVNAAGEAKDEVAEQVQYCQGGCGPYGGGGYGGGYGGNMPMGAPTSGFAPPAIPPNLVAGAPQWGMPITGTPIGLPGPPHIPLGSPAGLQKHVMKNRTRITLPPPVTKVHVSVKQRPGLNYPEPVNHVKIDETQREPFRLLPGWVSGLFHGHGGAHGGGNPYGAGYGYGECQ